MAVVRARLLAAQTDALFERLQAMSEGIQVNFELGFEFDANGKIKSTLLKTDPTIPGDHAAGQAALVEALRQINGHGPTLDLQAAKPNGKLLVDAVDEYFIKHEIKPRTAKRYRSQVASLIAFFGGETTLTSIDQQKFVAFTDHIKATIPNRRTAAGYITVTCSFLNWHNTRAGLPLLTARTLKPKAGQAASQERDAFTLDQLGLVFKNAARYRRSAPAKFWVTIGVAFLGCRLEELCQVNLNTDLVQAPSGIWYLRLDEFPDAQETQGTLVGKSIKSQAGWRVAPIHPCLVEHGFVTYLQHQKTRKHSRPFTGQWKRGSVEDDLAWSHPISKWGGRELSRMCKEGQFARRKLTYFQSMRHTFTTELARRSVSVELIAALQGQEVEGGGVNANRYNKTRNDPDFLYSLVVDHLGEYVELLQAALRAELANPDVAGSLSSGKTGAA